MACIVDRGRRILDWYFLVLSHDALALQCHHACHANEAHTHYDSVDLRESEEVDPYISICDKTNTVNIGRGAHRDDVYMLVL
jgi:hypothetical protein